MKKQTAKAFPYLNEDIETDVLIIGGGLTGASLAYFFVHAGIRTVLIEAEKLGYHNTCNDTGIALLVPELPVNHRKIQAESIDFPYSFYSHMLEDCKELFNSLPSPYPYTQKNYLLYSDTITGTNDLTLEYIHRKEKNIPCSLLSSFPGLPVKTGIFQENAAGIIQPYHLMQRLLERAAENGLRIFENTKAVQFQNTADRYLCKTNYHNIISSKRIICATGTATKRFTERKFGQNACRCQILSEPIDNVEEQWIHTVFQNIRTNTRFYVTEEHQILLETIGNSRNILSKSEQLEHFLWELTGSQPQIIRRTISKTIETRDELPVIGPDPVNPSLFYALPYGTSGVLSSCFAGKSLCSFYLGSYPKEFSFLSPGRTTL